MHQCLSWVLNFFFSLKFNFLCFLKDVSILEKKSKIKKNSDEENVLLHFDNCQDFHSMRFSPLILRKICCSLNTGMRSKIPYSYYSFSLFSNQLAYPCIRFSRIHQSRSSCPTQITRTEDHRALSNAQEKPSHSWSVGFVVRKIPKPAREFPKCRRVTSVEIPSLADDFRDQCFPISHTKVALAFAHMNCDVLRASVITFRCLRDVSRRHVHTS